MSTLFASFVALCMADAPPTFTDDLVLVCGGSRTAVVSDVTPGLKNRRAWRVMRPHGAAPSVIQVPAGQPRMFRFVSGGDEQDRAPAKAWIGVRLAPVPEALAAHLDRTGLMVANVAKGSPADAAGLERYDVIVAFDGANTESGEQLVSAIADVGAGRQAKITIIRKGGERDLKITPTSVPEMDGIEYKYEQPADPIVDDSTSIRGHTLKIGPDGQLQLQDLGQLNNLPDALRQYWTIQPDFKFDFQPLLPTPIPMDFDIDLGDLDIDGNMQLQIQTTDDGGTLMVRRDADGKITVERTDADGQRTTNEYADVEALQQGDEAAHRFYSRHAGGVWHWRHVQPDRDALPGLQRDFRDQLERRVREIQKRSKDANRDTGDSGRRRVRVESRSNADSDGTHTTSESFSVSVDDDGRIEVKVSRNGNQAEHSFTDEADFKSREPELFSRYKKMSE